MASLRNFLYGYGSTVKTPKELIVYDIAVETESNGGACCEFIVPGGVTRITGQMWGGGGGGAGSCFCSNGYPGAAGGYVEFTRPVTPGESITICAAGSTSKASSLCGNSQVGFDSYICKPATWCAFAGGGCHGYACSYLTCINQACCGMCTCAGMASCSGVAGSWVDAQYITPSGKNGGRFVDRCGPYDMQQIIPSGFGVPDRVSARHKDQRCGMMGMFPGGGGGTAHTCCNCCFCGGAGAGGAIYIIYE